jgi:hypothetical protein
MKAKSKKRNEQFRIMKIMCSVCMRAAKDARRGIEPTAYVSIDAHDRIEFRPFCETAGSVDANRAMIQGELARRALAPLHFCTGVDEALTDRSKRT